MKSEHLLICHNPHHVDAKTDRPVAGTVSIQIINTEKQDKWTAFGYQGAVDVSGRFAWQSGLFDGSGHQVNVKFTPVTVGGQQSTPIKVSQPVEVEGVAPPLHIRLISLGGEFRCEIDVERIESVHLSQEDRTQLSDKISASLI